jgi:hypothetical protein
MGAPAIIKDAEANRLYGSPEQVHLLARGERTTLLQAPEVPRQVPVDRGGRASLTRPEASPSVSSSPYSTIAGEDLLLYIAATTHVVSSAIVVERGEEGHAFGVQRPIYFISKVLSESKVRYPAVQKLLYAILNTSRKLHHYFDKYKITVITDFPLVDILHNQDAMGRISKWAVELGALSMN